MGGQDKTPQQYFLAHCQESHTRQENRSCCYRRDTKNVAIFLLEPRRRRPTSQRNPEQMANCGVDWHTKSSCSTSRLTQYLWLLPILLTLSPSLNSYSPGALVPFPQFLIPINTCHFGHTLSCLPPHTLSSWFPCLSLSSLFSSSPILPRFLLSWPG